MPAIFVIAIIFILPRCSTGWFIRFMNVWEAFRNDMESPHLQQSYYL